MAAARVTHPQLVELLTELEATSDRARMLVQSHDDRSFSAKPAPASWSAAEALVHLTLTNQQMAAEIDRGLSGARPAANVPDTYRYRMDMMGRLLRWSLEPPYRVKAPTTPGFMPTHVADRLVVLAQFLEQQRAVEEVIARSQGHDLSALKVTSPFNARVRYNVYAAIRVITTHNRRHLWQAERALERARS